MDIRVLRYFSVLADELHFGRAAARLHISQPPLSQQIRLLEEEMGTALFVRSQHRVSLTDAGRALKEQAPLVFAQFERAIELTRAAGRGEVGRLEIGVLSSVMVGAIPRALHTLAEHHPLVQWGLHELTPAAQVLALKERRLDVCFFRMTPDDPELASEAVLTEPVMVALPAGHRLAAQGAFDLSALAGDHFVSFGLEQSRLARFFRECCLRAGFEPDIRQQVIEVQTLLSLVREGLGVALLPASAREVAAPGVTFCTLTNPCAEISLHATYRADNASPVLALFLALVREQAVRDAVRAAAD